MIPTWHLVSGLQSKYHEREVLADQDAFDKNACIAVVETFGNGWYANAMPPHGEGTSSMISGMIRGGAFGDDVEAARAWCERICGLHPEKPNDRKSEPRP